MKLLTLGSSVYKLKKSDAAGKGYLSAILYLMPQKSSNLGVNLCPQASKGCALSCLVSAGRGQFWTVQQARQRKTELFINNRPEFEKLLRSDLEKFVKYCNKKKQKPAVRLNGTSDIMLEKLFPWLFTEFPHIQYYDYTKQFLRMKKFIEGNFPKNYHLTFSRSEINDNQSKEILKLGGSVAVVFSTDKFPKKWNGYKVYNADLTDLRFLDKVGVQALKAKGKARKDSTGFVIST